MLDKRSFNNLKTQCYKTKLIYTFCNRLYSTYVFE